MRTSKSRRRRGPADFDRVAAAGDRATATDDPFAPNPGLLTEEDSDDHVFFRRRERRHTPRQRHKDQQLATQVATIVGAALAALGDPRLTGLVVVGATPAPDASRIQVSLVDPDGGPVDALAELLARLRGALRVEVAAGIARRRVPELLFAIVSEEEGS